VGVVVLFPPDPLIFHIGSSYVPTVSVRRPSMPDEHVFRFKTIHTVTGLRLNSNLVSLGLMRLDRWARVRSRHRQGAYLSATVTPDLTRRHRLHLLIMLCDLRGLSIFLIPPPLSRPVANEKASPKPIFIIRPNRVLFNTKVVLSAIMKVAPISRSVSLSV
jgi:hypothetical protein